MDAECNCTIRLASCTTERVPKVCPERFATRELRCLGKMAGTTRLELATSAVTEWKQQVLTTTYKASRDCQVLDNTQKPNESRAGVRVEDFTGSYRSRTSASREACCSGEIQTRVGVTQGRKAGYSIACQASDVASIPIAGFINAVPCDVL